MLNIIFAVAPCLRGSIASSAMVRQMLSVVFLPAFFSPSLTLVARPIQEVDAHEPSGRMRPDLRWAASRILMAT